MGDIDDYARENLTKHAGSHPREHAVFYPHERGVSVEFYLHARGAKKRRAELERSGVEVRVNVIPEHVKPTVQREEGSVISDEQRELLFVNDEYW